MSDRDERIRRFCEQFGQRVPILLAPMAGACPAGLSVAMIEAGGMGARGALLMRPGAIVQCEGGPRGGCGAGDAERRGIWLGARRADVADAVACPVVAGGGIADARGVAAALAVCASAVRTGRAILRCPEAAIHTAWAAASGET